jgi:hypothetical protein
MKRFTRDVVLHNWALKLLAVAIAFSLWAVYAAQPLAEFGYDVPIAFVNVPGQLAISGEVPRSVHLLIEGHRVLLRRLTPADLAFSVDLGSATAGETSVRLAPEMAAVPLGTKVVSIAPQQFQLSLVANGASPGEAAESSVLK